MAEIERSFFVTSPICWYICLYSLKFETDIFLPLAPEDGAKREGIRRRFKVLKEHVAPFLLERVDRGCNEKTKVRMFLVL